MSTKREKRTSAFIFFNALAILSCCVFGLSGCGDDPLNPASSCDSDNTAIVKFENKTTSNTSYDVIWDGSKLTTISPGQTSQEYTVDSALHTVTFKIAGTNTDACQTENAYPIECYTYNYECKY